jgi:hypothetical protein
MDEPSEAIDNGRNSSEEVTKKMQFWQQTP